MTQPAISLTLVLRIEMPNEAGAFGALANTIGDAGGAINAVDMHTVGRSRVVRDVTISVASDAVASEVRKAIEAIDGAKIIFAADSTFLAHIGGKIRIDSKISIKTRQDLSTVYTPGVARVSMAIAADPSKAFQLTVKRNSVAVVTDGTAVLGLGDIGPLGALPVMEGKAMLFKQFADIDAFPICLDTKNVDEIVETVVRIAPVFGGINLEDISAPRCFEVEDRLIEALDIPVMHDDQHGTAVVILAALINAARVVGKRLEDLQVVVSGSGAAGTATIKMLLGRRRSRRHSGRPRRRAQPHRSLREPALAVVGRELQPREPARHASPRSSKEPTFSSASLLRASSSPSTSRTWGATRSSSRWQTQRRRSCPTSPGRWPR